MLSRTGGYARTLFVRSSGAVHRIIAWLDPAFGGNMTTRCRHHLIITAAVGCATASHYIFSYFAPDYLGFSPLAGFLASLIWIWND